MAARSTRLASRSERGVLEALRLQIRKRLAVDGARRLRHARLRAALQRER